MDKRRFISEDQQRRIETIVKTLKGSVHPIQIRNWLENFYQYDWDKALRVLERLKYFSLKEVIAEYDNSIKKLIQIAPSEKKIFVSASSEYGKSGPAMIYLFKKAPSFSVNEGRIKIVSHIRKLKQQGFKDGDILVLVDDFIGSGGSWSDFYRDYLSKQVIKDKTIINLVFICVAYIQDSVDTLTEEIPLNIKILGTPLPKAFATRGSPFGYRPNMVPIRNFCYRQAEENKLFVTHDYKEDKDIGHPLGYNNSQALVLFEHSIPNNTLPIIWSAKNGWEPLYPRGSRNTPNESRDTKLEARHWISVARKLAIIDFFDDEGGSIYSNINYRLFAVLRLKKQRVTEPKIFQLLGIGVSEYEHILGEGTKRGIFDNEGNVSSRGSEVYFEISRNVLSLQKEKQRLNGFVNNEISDNYVPTCFRGKT